MAKNSNLSPIGGLLLGLFPLGMGLLVMAVAADIIPTDESSIHAPRWILSAIGLIFVVAGALVFTSVRLQGENGQESKALEFLRGLLGFVVIFLFALVLNWIAFGSGERQFSSTISLPFISISSTDANELTGRVCFGSFAILLDALVLWVLINGLWRLLGYFRHLQEIQYRE